jgi:hypothetical protein
MTASKRPAAGYIHSLLQRSMPVWAPVKSRQGVTRNMKRSGFASGRARALLALSAALLLASLPALAPNALASSPVASPTVATGSINNIRGATASLNGTVNPNGLATEYFFQFGPTTAYGSETSVGMLPAGTTTVKVALTETGMQLNWHYRLVAKNAFGGEQDGKDRVYTVQTTRLKVALAKPSGQQVVGGSLTLSAVLTGTGAANHKVVLQTSPYPYSQAFVNVGAEQIASATGRVSFTVSHLTTSAEYRVATVDPRPTYSSPVTDPVAVRVTLHVRTSSHRGVVRLYGTVSPAQSGARVFFQIAKAPKPKIFKSEKAEERAEERGERYVSQFSASVKHATSTFSRFSMIVTVKKAGRYRAFVQVKRGALASGYSSTTVVLKAVRSSKKHKSKA